MKLSARSLPLCLSVVLGAAITAEIAHWYFAMRQPHDAAPPAAVRQRKAPPLDAQAIIEAHLFGVPEAKLANDQSAPETAANLVLEGTIATEKPNHGIAIISSDATRKVYQVGALIDGAALHSVYFDHVLLDRNGTLESLFLPRPHKQIQQARIKAPESPVEIVPVYIDNLGRAVDKPPGVLDKIMRAQSSMGKDEKMQGVIVYPQGSGASLRALGLVPGDMLISINGKPLNDFKSSQEILNGVSAADLLPATIERQGQTLNVMLNLAEAAREAATSAPQG